jgi:TRAP-type C4-dicarboxylate transport system permease small subunit
MNQNQKIPKYTDLIKKIKKRRKIAIVITVIAIIAIFIFGAPSTSTYTVNGVTETVTSEGMPAVLLILLMIICFIILFFAVAIITSPLTSSMDQECDPEKQLILYLNVYKHAPPNYILLQDNLYLGNYSEAIKCAEKMISERKRNKNYSMVGMFQKARCAFFLGDGEMLKETVAKYDQEFSSLPRQKEKQRLINEKCQTVLHILCALSEHDLEKIAALRDQLAPWNSNKSVEAFVQYLKGLIAFELEETKEAEFRFHLVAEQYPKLMLARLSNEYLEKLSAENRDNESDCFIPDESSDQTNEEMAEKIDDTVADTILYPRDWIIPPTKRPKPRGWQRAISILLFIFSICSIWGALMGVAILSASNPHTMGNENMWVFFLFLPIPLASIVFGFYLKKKGVKYKKNVIVGFIMAAFLCIYGSFTFIFDDMYSHSDEPILNAEQTLNIDIPAHIRINTHDWTQGTQSSPRGYIYYTSDIYFDDASVAEFEEALESDTKWMSYIPNDMVGITSYLYDMESSDYYLIYNKTTKEFNSLPSESGTYDFINILYNAKSNTMILIEYQIEYNK